MKPGYLAFAAALLAVVIGGCGGGGADSGGTGGTGVAAIVSQGVMTKGSVVVNGIRFDDTSANVMIDDTAKTAAQLKDGMLVKVRGTIAASGAASAQKVQAHIEVRGPVATGSIDGSVNPKLFVVFGQTVLIDDQTIFSNLAGFGAITDGLIVEVHGLRESPSTIRATRIEGSQSPKPDGTGMANGAVDEIRGVVSARNGATDLLFDVAGQPIDASGAVIVPASVTLENGDVVEARCSRPCLVGGIFVASRIEVEKAEDAEFEPGQGERFETEGMMSGFIAHPGTFFVGGVSVTTSSSTKFEGGVSSDLGDDVRVEVKGVWSGTTLQASEIEFKRVVVRLQGSVTSSTVSGFNISVAGNALTVETTSQTIGTLPPLPATCVQVRGERKAGTSVVVIARRIESNCSNNSRPFIQAPVEAKNPETTITLLGIVIDVTAPSGSPQYEKDQMALSRGEFFNVLSVLSAGPPPVAGTLVKVVYNAPEGTVRSVEIEDD